MELKVGFLTVDSSSGLYFIGFLRSKLDLAFSNFILAACNRRSTSSWSGKKINTNKKYSRNLMDFLFNFLAHFALPSLHTSFLIFLNHFLLVNLVNFRIRCGVVGRSGLSRFLSSIYPFSIIAHE